jgi:hypothetical protein
MASDSAPVLPPGWVSFDRADGTELRVDPKGRGGCLVVLWTVAFLGVAVSAGYRLGRLHSPTDANMTATTTVLAVLLVLLAIWVTYGDESWHLRENRLEKRLGFGPWVHRRVITDAVLEIAGWYDDDSRRLITRLYAVRDGRRTMILNRSELELTLVSFFIADRTGWRLQRGQTALREGKHS